MSEIHSPAKPKAFGRKSSSTFSKSLAFDSNPLLFSCDKDLVTYPADIPQDLAEIYAKDQAWAPASDKLYTRTKEIGKGTYGTVYLASRVSDSSSNVALKTFQLDDSIGICVTTLREIQLLEKVRSPSVVGVVGVVSTKSIHGHPNPMFLPRHKEDGPLGSGQYKSAGLGLTNAPKDFHGNAPSTSSGHSAALTDLYKGGTGDIIMALEYCSSDLEKIIQHANGLPPEIIQYFIYQILLGLKECHSAGIMHRDIKPGNVLIDETGAVKLADFGLARQLIPNLKYTPEVVSLWYRAPEVLLMAGNTNTARPLPIPDALNYDAKIDMWAVGCVLAELLRKGQVLFKGQTEIDVLQRISTLCGTPNKVNWPSLFQKTEVRALTDLEACPRELDKFFRGLNVPSHAIKLLDALLTLDPNQRLSAEAALKHEYFLYPPPLTKEQFHTKYALNLNSLLQKINGPIASNVSDNRLRKNELSSSTDQSNPKRRKTENQPTRATSDASCSENSAPTVAPAKASRPSYIPAGVDVQNIDIPTFRAEINTYVSYMISIGYSLPGLKMLNVEAMDLEELFYWRQMYIDLLNAAHTQAPQADLDYGM